MSQTTARTDPFYDREQLRDHFLALLDRCFKLGFTSPAEYSLRDAAGLGASWTLAFADGKITHFEKIESDLGPGLEHPVTMRIEERAGARALELVVNPQSVN